MLKLTENTFWSSSMDDAFKRARAYLKDHNLEESDYTLTQIEEHESFGCKLSIKVGVEAPISYTEVELLAIIDHILSDGDIMVSSDFRLDECISEYLKSNAKN